MTVYILEDNPKMNFISAQKYGELKPIFQQGSSVGLSPSHTQRYLENALKDFGDEDYIIPNGDPAIMIMAGFVLRGLTDVVTILKWDKVNYQYYPVTVEI